MKPAPQSSCASPGSGLSLGREVCETLSQGMLMTPWGGEDPGRDLLASSSSPPLSLPLCEHSHKTHGPGFKSQPGQSLASLSWFAHL